jgi:hypothetical protein
MNVNDFPCLVGMMVNTSMWFSNMRFMVRACFFKFHCSWPNLLQPHFEASVKMKLALPKVET